jgi:hypothetical protein
VELVVVDNGEEEQWEEDRETADEFVDQECHTVLRLKRTGVSENVQLTLLPRACSDRSLIEPLEKLISQSKQNLNTLDNSSSFELREVTSEWPQWAGLIFLTASAIFGLAAYFGLSKLLIFL